MFKKIDFSNRILTSLIASTIFLYFIKPILGYLWRFVSLISSHTYSGYVNETYCNASLGQRNWLDFVNFLILMFAILMIFIVIMIKNIFKHHELTIRAKLKIANEEEREQIFNKEKKRIANIGSHTKFYYYFSYVHTIVLAFFISLLIIQAYVDLQLNTSFNQKINALAPFVNDQEIKLLKSRWALMRNKDDYDKINMQIKMLAAQAHAELPPDLI